VKFLFYLPAVLVAIWSKRKEKAGAIKGRVLSELELKIIEPLHIFHPYKVRIHYIDKIEHPLSFMFNNISWISKMAASSPIGITFGYTIFIDKRYYSNLHLLIHELVHVKQYEKSGGHVSFLAEYIYQCLKFGYSNCPFEKEAEMISLELLK